MFKPGDLVKFNPTRWNTTDGTTEIGCYREIGLRNGTHFRLLIGKFHNCIAEVVILEAAANWQSEDQYTRITVWWPQLKCFNWWYAKSLIYTNV